MVDDGTFSVVLLCNYVQFQMNVEVCAMQAMPVILAHYHHLI
jgi:hypothetical protein